MKRIRKVKPKEISLVQAGANRRLIATYKSATAAEKATEMDDLREQILNTDPTLLAKFSAIAKSADGKYSPQAASVIKAVGRMLAPLAGQISMADLTKIGSAAGLGAGSDAAADDDEPMAKAAKKPMAKEDDDADDDEDEDGTELEEDETEDEEDDEGVDQGEAIANDKEEEKAVGKSDASGKAFTASKDADKSGMAKDHEAAAAAHKEAAKAAESDGDDKTAKMHGKLAGQHEGKAKGGDMSKSAQPSNIVALHKEKLDTESTRAEAAPDAQGDSVAKSATTPEPTDKARFEEIEKTNKAHQARIAELEAMVAKRSKDLDEERLYRETEAIKKSAGQDYAHLNFEADKLAPALKFLRDAEDQSHHETIHGLLKSASTQVAAAQKAAGIFKSVASVSAKASPDDTNFEDTIEANVDQLMQKSENKSRKRPVVYDEYVTKSEEGRTLLRNARAQKRGY